MKQNLATRRPVTNMEKLLIANALRRNEGNRQKTAKELGIYPNTLFRNLKALKIESPKTYPAESGVDGL